MRVWGDYSGSAVFSSDVIDDGPRGVESRVDHYTGTNRAELDPRHLGRLANQDFLLSHVPLNFVSDAPPYVEIGRAGDAPLYLRSGAFDSSSFQLYDGEQTLMTFAVCESNDALVIHTDHADDVPPELIDYLKCEAAIRGCQYVQWNEKYLACDASVPFGCFRLLSLQNKARLSLFHQFSLPTLLWCRFLDSCKEDNVFTTTDFARHFPLWLGVQESLAGRPVRKIAVLGLGSNEHGQTSEIYELAALFPEAEVIGFDFDREITGTVRNTGPVTVDFDGKNLRDFLEYSETHDEFACYAKLLSLDMRDAIQSGRVTFGPEITARVSARDCDFLTHNIEGEDYDLIVSMNVLRYLRYRDQRLHRVKSLILDCAMRLSDHGSLVVNDSNCFGMHQAISSTESQVLGLRRSVRGFLSVQRKGIYQSMNASMFQREASSAILRHCVEQARFAYSDQSRVFEAGLKGRASNKAKLAAIHAFGKRS